MDHHYPYQSHSNKFQMVNVQIPKYLPHLVCHPILVHHYMVLGSYTLMNPIY